MAISALKLRAAKHNLLYKRVPEQSPYILEDCLQVTQKTILNHNKPTNKQPPNTSLAHCSDSRQEKPNYDIKDELHPPTTKQTRWNVLRHQKRLGKPNTTQVTKPSFPKSTPREEHVYSQFSCPVLNVQIKKRPIVTESNHQALTSRLVSTTPRTPPPPHDDNESTLSARNDKNDQENNNTVSSSGPNISISKQKSIEIQKSLIKTKRKENYNNKGLDSPTIETKQNKDKDDTKPKHPINIDNKINTTPKSANSISDNINSSVWNRSVSASKDDTKPKHRINATPNPTNSISDNINSSVWNRSVSASKDDTKPKHKINATLNPTNSISDNINSSVWNRSVSASKDDTKPKHQINATPNPTNSISDNINSSVWNRSVSASKDDTKPKHRINATPNPTNSISDNINSSVWNRSVSASKDDTKPKHQINATPNPTNSIADNINSSVWNRSVSASKTDSLWEVPAQHIKRQEDKKVLKRSKTSTGYYQDRKDSLPKRASKSARPQRCQTAFANLDHCLLTESECRTKCLRLEECLYNNNLPKFQEMLLPFSAEDRKRLVDYKETKTTANLFFRACGQIKISFAKFIMEQCNPDLEIRGPFFIMDDHTQYMVTPLWQAAASGSLQLVRFLTEHGADINAVSDTGSSPLLAACYMSRVQVATYLIANKTTVNSCNAKGVTCLMNAVHNVDLVRLLVLNGAEINRADHRGNTSMHFAAEDGSVKTVNILFEHGGNPLLANKDGFNALHCAAKYRRRDVLEYLLQMSPLKVAEIVDVYEMIGAMAIIMDDDFDEGYLYWHKATTLRHLNKSNIIIKQLKYSLLAESENELEFTNVQQLCILASNPTKLRVQALMIYERQWGSSHHNFLHLLLYSGATFADSLNFKEAANLWRLPYQLHFDKYVHKSLEVCEPFNYNVMKSLTFMVKLLFQWRKVMTSRSMAVEKDELFVGNDESLSENSYNISEINVRRMLCLLCQHCASAYKWLNSQTTVLCSKYHDSFYLLLRSAICVLLVYAESFSREERCDEVWKYVQEMIAINPRGEHNETLLHMCLSPQTVHILDLDISNTGTSWPSANVINIALILGANPTAADKDGNTALHLAAILHKQGMLSEEDKVIRSLLSKGVHADQVNNFGQTAYDLLGSKDLNRYNCTWQKAISLQCLSARVITANGLEYIGEVPTSLYSFIELHRSVHIAQK